jgi:hypothetical protein
MHGIKIKTGINIFLNLWSTNDFVYDADYIASYDRIFVGNEETVSSNNH